MNRDLNWDLAWEIFVLTWDFTCDMLVFSWDLNLNMLSWNNNFRIPDCPLLWQGLWDLNFVIRGYMCRLCALFFCDCPLSYNDLGNTSAHVELPPSRLKKLVSTELPHVRSCPCTRPFGSIFRPLVLTWDLNLNRLVLICNLTCDLLVCTWELIWDLLILTWDLFWVMLLIIGTYLKNFWSWCGTWLELLELVPVWGLACLDFEPDLELVDHFRFAAGVFCFLNSILETICFCEY